MPRRHSLDLPSSPPSPGASPSGRPHPSADRTIAVLALLVAALLGLGGALSADHPVLFALAAALVAAPPITAVMVARAARQRRRRPQSAAPRNAWDDSTPDPLTGVPVLADFDRELARVLRRADGDVDITVLRLALVPVGGSAEALDLRRRLVLAAVNWQEVLRPEDRLARIADDRFAVLLTDCSMPAAARVVDRLRDATPPGAVCAVGAATWNGEESAARLLQRAGEALDSAPQLQGGDVLRDPARVAAVRMTDIVAARRSGTFDHAAKSLAWLLHAPVITIALVDDRFEHVIGAYGLADPAQARASVVAEEALGHQAVVTGRPLVASDAPRHPALYDHRRVVGGDVRACATVPLVSDEGHVVGNICAIRTERHAWSADEVRLLRSTATRVATELTRVPRVMAA